MTAPPYPTPMFSSVLFATNVCNSETSVSSDVARWPMFTIYHMCEVCGALLGVILLVPIGNHYFGWPGGIAGAILGAVLGFLIGRVPGVVAVRAALRDLRRKSVPELRGLFQRGVWPAYHLVLRELVRRGEDVTPDFPFIRALLVADDPVQRHHGIVNLVLYYPHFAARIPEYRPEESAESCRTKVGRAGFDEPQQ